VRGRQAWHLALGFDDGSLETLSLRSRPPPSVGGGGGGGGGLRMSLLRRPEYEWEFTTVERVAGAVGGPVTDISIAHPALLACGARPLPRDEDAGLMICREQAGGAAPGRW
jgi:hypothetical protein